MPENRAADYKLHPKLFADVMIPGTEHVAMHRMFVGLRVAPFEAQEKTLYQTEVTGRYPGRIGSKAVWWRVKRDDGSESFINVDPGEYRTETPTGEVVIFDVPEMPPRDACRDLLRAAISRSELGLITQPYVKELVSLGKEFLQNPSTVKAEGLKRVRGIVPLMREASGEQIATPLGRLVYDCLDCPRLDHQTFATIMVLLQLQRMMNQWIEQDWLDDPFGALGGFLHIVQGKPETRDRLLDVCAELVEIEYQGARESLNEALNSGSLFSMGQSLARAYHGFFMVHLLTMQGDARGLFFPKPRSPIVIEESVACTVSAFGTGVRFITEHPTSMPRRILARAEANGTDEFAAARAWGSNHISPIVNRLFANILGAHAMTLAPQADKVKAGLAHLIELRDSLSPDSETEVEFESGWIDQAMLGAYKQLNMNAEGETLATRIVGRLVVSGLLGRG